MSPLQILSGLDLCGFPRVSGDEPPYYRMWERHEEFSPRERG